MNLGSRRPGGSPRYSSRGSLSTASDCDSNWIDSQSHGGTPDTSFTSEASDHPLHSIQCSVPYEANISSYSTLPLDLPVLPTGNGFPNDTLTCRYPCLNQVFPVLQGIITPDDACSLLDIFFTDPDTVGSHDRCPYVLTSIIRKKSLLRQKDPRPVSPALLVTILWCVSHTANLEVLRDASIRSKVIRRLYFLSIKLLRARDSDHLHHTTGKTIIDFYDYQTTDNYFVGGWVAEPVLPVCTTAPEPDQCPIPDHGPEQNLDDVISYTLLACVISGTESKYEYLRWWKKAVHLVKKLGFNSEARIAQDTPSSQQMSLASREEHEEYRRTFWLLYTLDRHFALSFDEPLHIQDSECHVLHPLPEWIWRDIEDITLDSIPPRVCGPPTRISGTGFFDYFLPLMVILGDILELRSRTQHPRLRCPSEAYLTGTIQTMLSDCEYSLDILRAVREPQLVFPTSPLSLDGTDEKPVYPTCTDTDVMIAYSQYILRVLHILLYADKYTVSPLDVPSNCGPSAELVTTTANAITAAESIAHILELDNNLSFMPFLFGIYLSHGSLNFLSVADQMSRVGASDLAGQGCGTILRAHEVATRTFNSSFQVCFNPFGIYDRPQSSNM